MAKLFDWYICFCVALFGMAGLFGCLIAITSLAMWISVHFATIFHVFMMTSLLIGAAYSLWWILFGNKVPPEAEPVRRHNPYEKF